MSRAFIAAAMSGLLFLAGCGGSSSADRGNNQALFALDTVVLGDVLVYAPGQRARLRSSCRGARCTVTYQGVSETIDIRDIDPRNQQALRITGQHNRNGVQVARLRGSNQGFHFDMWGAWATYSAATNGEGQATIQGVPVDFIMPLSLGEGAGTNPVTGSAIWTGAMIGTRIGSSSPGAAVAGDARMQVNFSTSNLDLAFTNIAEISTGTIPAEPIPTDMVW